MAIKRPNMDAEEKKKPLFSDFPPVSREEWEEKIKKDLKGADYERTLIWKTGEGFNVRPYYRREDMEDLKHLVHFPGKFPFIRGKQASGNHWRIRQDIRVKDICEANEKALDILMKGVDSLGFILEEEKDYSKDDIDSLLKNIHAHAVELNFMCGKQSTNIVRIIDQLVKEYNRDLNQIHGAVDYDPLGRLIARGRFYTDEEGDFRTAKALIELADHLPHFRVMAVHGSHFHNSGSSTVQELGFALAAGNEYLAKLTDLGLSVTQVAPRIRFNFATGSNYFMEIAKYRAARMLWARIVKEYGGDDRSAMINIRAVNSKWNKTLYDPHVNMLRTTTEAMSAILGGIDSLTISPYDEVYDGRSPMGERVARNQQLLLKEESYFDKVADPAAGSYYIESLTDSIAKAAWETFIQIEGKGGFLECVKHGDIQRQVREHAMQMDMALAKRKRVLVGTNQYPNFTEALDQEVDGSVLKPEELRAPEAEIETLRPYRGAQAFEELRYRTDRFVKAGGKRPEVFPLAYGNLAMRKARATFSSNFFACAGFRVLENMGFASVEDGIKAARESNAEFVVICSSDEEYKDKALVIYQALKDSTNIILAGYPKNLVEELEAGGLKEFIHARANVLESLRHYQQMTDIK